MAVDPENGVRQLSAAERAALIQAGRRQAQRERVRDVIPRRPNSDPVRASFSQERLWFLHQLDPDSPVYNVPVGLLIDGPLDVAALKASLLEVVRRHETLRTTFPVVDGVPFQAVSEQATLDVPIVDLEAIAEDNRLAAAQRVAAVEARRPFRLATGPLLRATLVRRSERSHALVLVMHHVISDGWSFSILVRELAAAYDVLTAGRVVEWPALPIQYADFACWQRERLSGDALARLMGFWRGQLGGALPVLTWPAGRSRTPDTTASGARLTFAMPRDVSAALQRFSQERGVTLFVTLLAAFDVLLHRYTGETDIVVGSPVANRSREEVEGIIGYFSNTIVVRARIDTSASFAALVDRVGAATFEAIAHEDLPFERLVEELQLDRDLGRNPVFQTMVVHQAPLPRLRLSTLEVAIWDLESGTSKFDLTLNTWVQDGVVRGFLEFPTDLFDAAEVQRMAGHFATLAGNLAARPDRPVSEASLFTAAEYGRIVRDWNETDVPYASDRCLHQLIEEQVARQPDAIAVVADAAHWTYAEIDGRANQLAQHLRVRGVGPDTPVALCLERSVHVPISIMAVLKAGGAYVPLDPSYPAERLEFMLADARVPLVVTSGTLGFGPRGVEVVDLEAHAAHIGRMPTAPPTVDVRPDNLAYLIYTSGSTGTPKGVLLDHRGRVNNFTDFNRRFAIGAGDALFAVSSLGFDMSAYDVLGTLAAGATIVLPPAQRALDAAQWLRTMNECGVTIWHSAPALLEAVVDEAERSGIPPPGSLRCVLLGGDWIPVSLPERLRTLVPDAVVVSLGGATEASMDSIIHIVETSDRDRRTIPYGRPMVNQRAYVVTSGLTPAPIGVAGDLYLGGVGVGYGYLRRPELTAAAFVPNPFSGVPGDRIYRTGDLARYMPDGTIELIGRKDFQVKIRGVRIELGEIADALRRHPDVREAVVTTTGEGSERHLVAHVVLSAGATPDLQTFLRRQLPDTMIPSIVMPWPALPLTPNGKIDRRALAKAPLPVVADDRPYVAPRSAVEQVVAGTWLDVLQTSVVSVTDNFFALRGHSLLATRVMSRLAEYFDVDLPLRAIFEAPTVAGLAVRIEQTCRAAGIDADHVARVLLEVNALTEEQVQLRLDDEPSAAEGAHGA